MPYSHLGDSDDDEDDLVVEDCEKDLRALKEACRMYGDDGDGDGDEFDEEFCCRYADVGVGDDDDDDDVLLLSIQKRFGAFAQDVFKPAQEAPSPTTFEEEEDEEILRAVQRRFTSINRTDSKIRPDSTGKVDKSLLRDGEENYRTLFSSGQDDTEIFKSVSIEEAPISEISSDLSPYCDASLSPAHNPEPIGFTFPGQVEIFDDTMEGLSDEPIDGVVYNNNLLADLSAEPQGGSIRSTLDALKKNRLCQRVFTSKLELLQSKLEENADLKKRVRTLLDFQSITKRRYAFEEDGINPAVHNFCIGNTKERQPLPLSLEGARRSKSRPPDNADVAKLRAVQKKYSLSSELRIWSKEEKKELVKGVKQQVQESRIRSAMEMFSAGTDDATFLDDQVKAIAERPLTSEDIRAALPIINWNEVARVYVVGRSPTECWIQWSNHVDPLIHHGPWTKTEDKRLWSIARQHKLCNWDCIAQALGTHRSVAQCLIRYQRSLNAGIMRSAWTQEEDEQLRAAVELYGDQDWLTVAASLEGRTGPQCWNRWHKILHPMRQKSGRWDVIEDKRLKLAVSVYGPRMWKVIAAHVPGRTEVQCRERWCNVLDPSLTLAEWTEEEDQRLEEAVEKHGQHRWSTVANDLKPRTDNQCWRRWKHLHPEHLLAFQKDNQIQKAALINNFVGRRKERSKLTPSDFVPEPGAFAEDNKASSKLDNLNSAKKCENGEKCKRPAKKPKPVTTKKLRVDGGEPATGDIQCMVTSEYSKMRRAERLEKLRQARATGKMLSWKRLVESRTDLGLEGHKDPSKHKFRKRNTRDRSNHGKNGTTDFVRLIHEVACVCHKSENKNNNTKDITSKAGGNSRLNITKNSGRRAAEDQLKSGADISDPDMAASGNAVTESTKKDEEVEAAVKAVLSWPFLWGLQDFWRKEHEGL